MPTRAALTSVVFGVIAAVTGRLLGLVELFVLAAGLLLAPMLAWCVVRLPRANPVVERHPTPARPTVGDDVTVDIDLTFEHGSAPTVVHERLGPDTAASATLPRMRNGSRRRLTLHVTARRRGVIDIGPTSLELRDPLGLCARATTVAPAQRLLVRPARVSVTAPSLDDADGALVDALRKVPSLAPSDNDFRGVRSYRPGDDVRRVNWRASARRDSVLVNEFEPVRRLELQVMLDTERTRHTDESFELAVSIAASLVDASGSADCATRLVVDRHSGGADPTSALDQLALVGPGSGGAFAAIDPRDPTAVIARVVITGRVDAALTARLDGLRPRPGVGLVITTADSVEPVPAPWLTAECASLSTFADVWSRFVRPRRRGSW